MRGPREHERGAALVMVLVFMVVTLILITAVLAVSGNEIKIAALHRDGVKALELANAAIQETITRILTAHSYLTIAPVPGMSECRGSEGLPVAQKEYPKGFTTSLSPTSVTVGVCGAGTGSQLLEIRADATVGQAVRRLSRIVRIEVRTVPPEIVLAGFLGGGGAEETVGDTYAPLSAIYKTNPDGFVYSGWRVGKSNSPGNAEADPNDAAWCYGRQINPDGTSQCTQDNPDDNWYPGTRLAISETDPVNTADIDDIKNNNIEGAAPPATCASTVDLITNGVRADDTRPFAAQQQTPSDAFNRYGFDQDALGTTFQAMTNKHPCGLPYKYVAKTFDIQNGNNTLTITRYFKTVIYEQWFETYYRFDSASQTLKGRNGSPCTNVCLALPNANRTIEPNLVGNVALGLPANRQFAAIPPFPSAAYLTNICNNANPYEADPTGSPSIYCNRPNTAAYKSPVNRGDYQLGDPSGVTSNTCPRKGGTPRVSYFRPKAGESVKFGGNAFGYGTMLIEGNAEFAGGFTYTGTIIATGNVEFGGGNVTINGGLIVGGRVTMTGTLDMNASDCIGNIVFIDQITITPGAMWER